MVYLYDRSESSYSLWHSFVEGKPLNLVTKINKSDSFFFLVIFLIVMSSVSCELLLFVHKLTMRGWAVFHKPQDTIMVDTSFIYNFHQCASK